MSTDAPVRVLVTVDTEEDDWGSYAPRGATVKNIRGLPEAHRRLRDLGARPTYFVNLPPLETEPSRAVLRELAGDSGTEIGTHCHPWNTPPLHGADPYESMMYRLPEPLNRAKLETVGRAIEEEVGVRPVSFRAGRWGLGPTVARPLAALGYRVDASVSPFVDWSGIGGPDYSRAPHLPYRFDPDQPLTPTPDGALLEIPTTVGFLRGEPRASARRRLRLERSPLRHLKVVGVLDRLGILARRWLSPEQSDLDEMKALADASVGHGARILDLTFHSSTLLPGATPFVADEVQRQAFLARIEGFLEFCSERGWTFATVEEAAEGVTRSGGSSR